MKIKGILFDKDGTLLKFGSIWPKVIGDVIDDLLEMIGEEGNKTLKNELCKSIGLKDGVVDEKGILASGTSLDITRAFQDVLPKDIRYLHEWLSERVLEKTKQSIEHVESVCNLSPLFSALRNKGIVVGIATADDYETTALCLEHLGIREDIQFVGTADLYEKKPSSQVVEKFCEKFGLAREEVAMVGDTVIDMQTAKNSKSGFGIGVLSGVGSKEELEKLADFVIPNVEHLINHDKFIWEVKGDVRINERSFTA
ncbi:HAD family hydrolase [Peribacillus cavernae]|uniref:HAD family hydrolase n=1 Tax=Peribacillus cavernae TaxID=1674310 RepID=A0A433HKJ3_9BACI|nr:HAD family hydrolase [Peribacillus cavernae]MDQ0219209.1 phosphoglycolate phosphatase [Peribacillus cavernae]RUQ28572.1 HAD family hydrolase [Peribacillus cavernae]